METRRMFGRGSWAWLVAAGLLGCSTARKDALERAQAAQRRGDVQAVAVAYRDACRADPDDEELCAVARQREQVAVTAALDKARAACAAGDIDGCLRELRPARALSGAPRVLELFDEAGRLHAEECGAPALSRPEDAVALVRCLELRAPAVDTPQYRDRLREGRSRAGQFLSQLAGKAAGAGGEYALLAVASCLAGDTALAHRRDQARLRFYTADALPVRAVLSDAGRGWLQLGDVCALARPQLPEAARCDASASGSEGLELEVQTTVGEVRHQTSDEHRQVRYRAGVERYPNAERQRLLDQADRARFSLDDLERDWKLQEADCESAQTQLRHDRWCHDCPARAVRDSVCRRRDALKSTYDERRREQRDLESRAKRMPETLEREVFDTFSYVVRQHHWSVPFELRFLRDRRPVLADSGQLELRRVEHVGFAPAALEASPRRDPTPAEYAELLGGRVAKKLAVVVRQELAERGPSRLAGCGEPGEDWTGAWLQCWTAATLWLSGDPATPFVTWLGSRVDQLAARTGRRLPAARCAR